MPGTSPFLFTPRSRRIAAPLVGGITTSFLLELTVYPAIFAIWKGREVRRGE